MTRPVTDRVKQSLFDILAPKLENATVWDLFAGTGSMGLEALSRGAEQATFFESDRSAIVRLKRNIADLGLQRDRAVVQSVDLFKLFRSESKQPRAPLPDLIFLDPPYRFLADRAEDLRRLARQLAEHHLSLGGTIIFRHDARDSLELPPLAPYDHRTYGGMTLELLENPTTAL